MACVRSVWIELGTDQWLTLHLSPFGPRPLHHSIPFDLSPTTFPILWNFSLYPLIIVSAPARPASPYTLPCYTRVRQAVSGSSVFPPLLRLTSRKHGSHPPPLCLRVGTRRETPHSSGFGSRHGLFSSLLVHPLRANSQRSRRHRLGDRHHRLSAF